MAITIKILKIIVISILIVSILSSGCCCITGQKNTATPIPAADLNLSLPSSRSFYMSMSPFPYDLTNKAQIETYGFLHEHTDMAFHHFDSGVPWPEAYNNSPYRKNVEDDLNYRVSQIKKGQKVYLTTTPVIITRDGMSGYRGDSDNLERPGKWKDKAFDDPEAIQAYVNYCRYMIKKFKPDYFAYGIEVNILADKDPEEFEKYLVMAEQAYTTLKKENPGLPIFLTLHIDTYVTHPVEQKAAIDRLLKYSDYVAVSTYPYTYKSNPKDLPENWFSQMHELAPEKPFAIAETGFAAEDLVLKQYGVTLKGNEEWQAEYMNFMLSGANDLNAEFVIWFVSGDYDKIWAIMEKNGSDELFKLWKDNGLVDGNRDPRKSLSVWDAWRSLPLE
jgi:hypothetical protein